MAEAERNGVRKTRAARGNVDPFGFDPIARERAKPFFRFLYKYYWRVEVEGLEHLPAEGPVLLAANHSGALPLDARVARCVAIKAEIVAADEREGGRRALLNYGHTLAHALETAGHYDLRHGEAVALGLIFAARLAQRLERVDAQRVDEHEAVVAAYGLPTRLDPGHDLDELVELMKRDKKAFDGLTFALDGPDGVDIVERVPPDVVRSVLGAWLG